MRKGSSIVWRFFERIENDDKKCYAVLCKLCDTQYKFFGNTTNLRSHLINKHPLQWELSHSSTFEEPFHVDDEESNQSTTSQKKRKYSKSYKDRSARFSISVENPRNTSAERIPKIEIQRVDVLDNLGDSGQNEDDDNEGTFSLVRQLHDTRASEEEWLDDDPYSTHVDTYERKMKRVPYRKIKREVHSSPRRSSSFNQQAKYDTSPIIIDQSVKDEYSVFGEYVANKLRKFKRPRTQGNLQQLITTILWQAEYGTYDNADAVKRVLMYTVQESEQEQPQQADMETHIQADEVTVSVIREEEPNQSIESLGNIN